MKVVNDIVKAPFEIDVALNPSTDYCGVATLNSGAVTVSNTVVSTNSIILVTFKGAFGHGPSNGLYIDNIVDGVSFDIMDSGSVSGDVCWFIVKV